MTSKTKTINSVYYQQTIFIDILFPQVVDDLPKMPLHSRKFFIPEINTPELIDLCSTARKHTSQREDVLLLCPARTHFLQEIHKQEQNSKLITSTNIPPSSTNWFPSSQETINQYPNLSYTAGTQCITSLLSGMSNGHWQTGRFKGHTGLQHQYK